MRTDPASRFQTERTRRFRAGDLGEADARTVSYVEQFGCSIVQVKRSGAGPGWSYTLGVYDTAGQPEIITVGLREGTAAVLLNEAAKRLRDGVDLMHGRHRDMVGEVECEFRPGRPEVGETPDGLGALVLRLGGVSCTAGGLPRSREPLSRRRWFDERFAQPLLQPGARRTSVEDHLWVSADPKSSLFDWKFPDPPHTRVFLSETVHQGTEAVTYVSHDEEDSAWQFLGDSMADGGGAVFSCFHHPIDNDLSLSELADLPLGWCARRERPGEPWVRYKHVPEEI